MAIVTIANNEIQKEASDGLRRVVGTAGLTNADVLEIPTGLTAIVYLVTSVNSNPAAGGAAVGTLEAKKHATAGSISAAAIGATGATEINWMAVGY